MALSRRSRLLIGLGVVVLIGAFLVGSLVRSGNRGKTEVKMEAVRRGHIESWVRAPGQVQPERLVQISSNVQGRVEGLSVEEGSRVRRGEMLLSLDDERYRSALSGMQAQVDAAQADLALAAAQRERSGQTLARQERLFAESLLSPEAYEESKTAAKVDEARYASSREELRRRKAALAESQKDIKETVFRAPIDGVVTALNVEEGENVVTGTMNNPGTVILTLADLDTMEVEADVDESDVVRIQPGIRAKVKVDAWEDSALVGTVTSVGMSGRRGASGTTQQQGTSFQVKVRILDPPEALRPGMSADVELLAGERDSALVVPIQSLVAQPERIVKRWFEKRANPKAKRDPKKDAEEESASSDTARVAGAEKLVEGIFLEKSSQAFFVPLRLGLRGDTHVEIFGEVKPGDKVVTGPYRTLRKLKDGEAIRPEKAKKGGGKEPDAGSAEP